MDKRKGRQWSKACGNSGTEVHLSTSLCCKWYGEIEGCEVGKRAKAIIRPKAPTCPERWPSAAGSHALSSGFPVQSAGMGEGAEKAVSPPVLFRD